MNGKKIVSLLAAMALAVSLVPLGARADSEVSYRACDTDGTNWTTQTCDAYTILTGEMMTSWGAGNDTSWYVARDSVTLESRVRVTGDVRLILADGCQLTANNGIYVPEGASLTVYAQSEDTSMGALIATGANTCAGIGGKWNTEDHATSTAGTITINGGTIHATGGPDGTGIGGGLRGSGGTITINGGDVTAQGGSVAAGIGGGNTARDTSTSGGNITINGGTVRATGGDNGAGIGGGGNGSGSGTITINGGDVTAYGNYSSAGIGGGGLEPCGAVGTITINGGSVTAVGGNEESFYLAADIGGGSSCTVKGTLLVQPEAIIHADLSKNPTSNATGIVNDGSGNYTVYGNAELAKDLAIPDGCSLTIPNGASLTIPQGVTLTNTGHIENRGHIENKGAITNSGTFTNNGTILNRGTITGDVSGSGTVTVPSTSSGPTTYAVTVAEGENGTVTASTRRSAANRTVKLTVTPHQGYRLDSLTVTDAKGGSVAVTEGEKSEYTFSMPRSAVTVTGTFVPDLPFVDVPADAYYRAAVKWALDNGVTTGTDETHFSPDATCTRGQVVTFLWRAKGEPAPRSANNPFADVSPSDYYYNAVLWAVEQGITTGTGDTTFSPGTTCARAHIVTFLWRCEGKPDDAGSSGWYTDAVNWAQANDLLSGSGKAFVPGDDCPRADVVDYLYRDLVK